MSAFLLALALVAQGSDPWADASPEVEYGAGAGYGQDHYPDNILGPPDPSATPESPAATPEELLTLGEEGRVVVEFTDNIVTDGPGADLTVFENVMELSGGDYWRECAFVEVSQDGEDWTRFPWNPSTLEGLAGVWPTTGEDPTDPGVSGGDQFDLAELGLDWITHVRLVDCGPEVADDGLFDLDAVVAVNWETGIAGPGPEAPSLLASTPFGHRLQVWTTTSGRLSLYSLRGRLLKSVDASAGPSQIPTADLPAGCCLLVFRPREGAIASRKVLRL